MRALRNVLLATVAMSLSTAAFAKTNNVILFVADGLRPGVVNDTTAPTMSALLKAGVRFVNTYSMFPTFTTANASAMATGHYLGDTGDFSNTIYTGFPIPPVAAPPAIGSVTPFLENDRTLGIVDAHFGGNYLNEITVLQAARAKGYSTAAVGKHGPTLIQDHLERTGQQTITIDDATGTAIGIPLSDEVSRALTNASLPTITPGRGANGVSGTNTVAGTLVANVDQQQFFADAATKAILPIFKSRNKPFALVYWSRDPDGTQHNQGDSLNTLEPGINGPTTFAAIKNADNNLAQLIAALKAQGLYETTNIVLTADHGFSTISKQTNTSYAAKLTYPGVNAGFLPKGFVAIDIAHALGLSLYDPDSGNVLVDPTKGQLSVSGNGLIGADPLKPVVVVAANGGSDLIYIPSHDAAIARKVVDVLSANDYTSGVFVDDALGKIPGTLATSNINFKGSAVTPQPSVVVNFRSFTTGCADISTCGVEVADSGLQQGQGMHGSFSRADTAINLGAIGPDFRTHFVDPMPASNADVGKTLASILNLHIPAVGSLLGRTLNEALLDHGTIQPWYRTVVTSKPDQHGHRTVLNVVHFAHYEYFESAGYEGSTLGLAGAAAQFFPAQDD